MKRERTKSNRENTPLSQERGEADMAIVSSGLSGTFYQEFLTSPDHLRRLCCMAVTRAREVIVSCVGNSNYKLGI